jgi:hypothetical protein
MVGQAARGDDRGAQHVIERPGQLRAGGAGEAGCCRFGPPQAGQLVAGGQEPGQPTGADPQRQAVVAAAPRARKEPPTRDNAGLSRVVEFAEVQDAWKRAFVGVCHGPWFVRPGQIPP